MILWNKKSIIEALGSDLIYIDENYDYKIDSVVFDNRAVKEYSLFIAKKGEKTDGHNFIEQTLQNNKNVVALANNGFSEKFKNNSRIILVKDTVIAMEKMAKYARNRIKGKVIGITGSVGKTTTKEIFYSCLSNFGKVHCNIQSFNNYIGVMTTLCNLPQDTDFAIIEMGMSEKGEMERLSEIVRPDITTILNIFSAHLEFFKEEKDIAYAKSEIFKYQNKNGFTVLNKTNKHFNIMEQEAKNNKINDILTFSENKSVDADVVINNYSYNDKTDLYDVGYKINNKIVNFELANDDYNIALNLMSLLCVMNKLKLNFDKIKNSLKNFKTPRGRNNIEEVIYNGKNITIINGSYNAANPLVFIRGLELMNKLSLKKNTNRKIAIFGDIKEAGDKTEEFMLSLKQPIIDSGINVLICIGDKIKVLHEALKNKIETKYFEETSEVIPLIKDLLQDNDLVFIKSSNSVKTWKILDEITGSSTDKLV